MRTTSTLGPVPPGTSLADRFVAEHRFALLRLAVGLCHDRGAAEDLAQDTAERLLKRSAAFARAEHPWAYARKVMVRLYLDRARDRGTEAVPVVVDTQLPAHDPFVELEDADVAAQMISMLPPRARAVLTLRYIEDLDDHEIARALGITTSTVRVTAHRALRRLRTELAPTTRPTGDRNDQ